MRTLVSLYVWSVWLVHLFVPGPIAVLCVAISPRRLGFWATYATISSAFFFSGIRVKAIGRENVDWQSAHLFMGNHQTMVDPFAMILAMKHHMVVIEKVENLKLPVYGWLSRAWGNITIQREDVVSARGGISIAAERLRSGLSIGIMPEGTRSKDGSIGQFKKGGFHMAVDAAADIVPFTINGSFDRLPRGGWHVFPGTIEISFGEPISAVGTDKDHLEPLMERVRTAVLASFKGPKPLPVADEQLSAAV